MSSPADAPASPEAPVPLDVERIRRDFPILRRLVRGHPLVYLDSAATALKPQVVPCGMTRLSKPHWSSLA